jgi:hypothetical protein
MIWWFLILACGVGAVLWAGLAIYIRVRRQWKETSSKEPPHPDL